MSAWVVVSYNSKGEPPYMIDMFETKLAAEEERAFRHHRSLQLGGNAAYRVHSSEEYSRLREAHLAAHKLGWT